MVVHLRLNLLSAIEAVAFIHKRNLSPQMDADKRRWERKIGLICVYGRSSAVKSSPGHRSGCLHSSAVGNWQTKTPRLGRFEALASTAFPWTLNRRRVPANEHARIIGKTTAFCKPIFHCGGPREDAAVPFPAGRNQPGRRDWRRPPGKMAGPAA